MSEFIDNNASAIFALSGALGGSLISFVAGWLLRKRDYDLRLWETLLERRIDAHERLIAIAMEMRVMVGSGDIDAAGEVVRSPQVLLSQEAFDAWFTKATSSFLAASTWLSTPAKREANFVQDYLVNLYSRLKLVPSEQYFAVGVVIRQDFIDMSALLERASFEFFEKDIRSLKLTSLDDWHKHPREQTIERLGATALIRCWSDVERAVGIPHDRTIRPR